MITGMANRYWTFFRQTAYVLEATTAAASMPVTRGLGSGGSYVQVTVAGGTTGSGTVDVVGTDTSGAAQSETLTFASNSTIVTVNRFATVTSFTTTGLAGEASVPTVEAQAVSADGTKNLIRYTVAANRPVFFGQTGNDTYPSPESGSYERSGATVGVDYEGTTWAPRPDDVAVDDETSDEWLVQGVREIRMGFGIRPDHYALRCTLLNS